MAERVGKAYVLRPDEGRAIDLGGFSVSVKAGADDTAGALSLLEADEPPGFGPPLHIHHDAAETFSALASPELHNVLTTLRGWSHAKYARWLRRTVRAAVLG